MSRTRFRMQDIDNETHASRVQWSGQSDGSSDDDDDEDKNNELERSPSPAAELLKSAVEENKPYADYEAYGRYVKDKCYEAAGSPVLKKRDINQYAIPPGKLNANRDSSKVYHPEACSTEIQSGKKFEHDYVYSPKYYDMQKLIKKPQVQVKNDVCVRMQKHLVLLGVSIALLVTLGYSCYIMPSEENGNMDFNDMITVVSHVLSQFKNIPQDVVFQFSAGIRNIMGNHSNSTSVFVLLHDDSGQGSYCLANAVANLAMKYLHADENTPLVLNSNDLLKDENMTQDYGWIIENYKPLVEKHRTVIISDLQKLPGKMAMAFHFFCDIYNPIVPNSLFLFTLHVKNDSSKKKMEQAESTLHNIWRSDIDDDQRQALITRLTEDIIFLPADILLHEECP